MDYGLTRANLHSPTMSAKIALDKFRRFVYYSGRLALPYREC